MHAIGSCHFLPTFYTMSFIFILFIKEVRHKVTIDPLPCRLMTRRGYSLGSIDVQTYLRSLVTPAISAYHSKSKFQPQWIVLFLSPVYNFVS